MLPITEAFFSGSGVGWLLSAQARCHNRADATKCSLCFADASLCFTDASLCFTDGGSTLLHRTPRHPLTVATQYPEQSHKKQPLLGTKIFFYNHFSLSRMYSTHIWCAVKKNCCWQQLVKNVHTSLLSVRGRVTQDLEGYSADLPQTVKVSSNVHFGLNFEFWIPCFHPGLSLDSWEVGHFIITAKIQVAIRVDQSIT